MAIFDLLEDNRFALPQRDDRPVPPGPYRLHLAIRERRLVFDIARRGRRGSASSTCRCRPSTRW